jgi:hypothetical protein
LKKTIPFIVTFAAGLGLGALTQYELPRPPLTESERKTEQRWNITYTEEKTHARMLQFQSVLEDEGIANDAETLSKQIDAQRGIEDLIIKYREAEYAKWAPFTGIFGVVLASFLSILATLLVTKRSPHDGPDR